MANFISVPKRALITAVDNLRLLEDIRCADRSVRLCHVLRSEMQRMAGPLVDA
jgi:hypothetical protein